MLLSPGINSNVEFIRMKTKRLLFVVVVHSRGENDGIFRISRIWMPPKTQEPASVCQDLYVRDNFNYLETVKCKIIKEHKNLLVGQRKTFPKLTKLIIIAPYSGQWRKMS